MRIVRLTTIVVLSLIFHISGFGQGRLMWQDRKDFSGGADAARAVTVGGDLAVAAGIATVTGGLDFIVRAYDISSGKVRWSDQTPAYSGIHTSVFVTSAANAVFAAGYKPSTLCCSDIFVRAYNAQTGKTLWDDVIDKGRDDLPQGIAASPAAVVVVGYGGNTGGNALNFIAKAYDTATGALLWQDVVDNGPLVDDAAWGVAIEGNRVFVVGTTSTPSGQDLILRAYNVTTGRLIWQVRRGNTSPFAVTAIGNRVFVVGGSFSSSSVFAGAFDSLDGSLVWQDTNAPGVLVDLKIQGKGLVAVGSTGRGLLVRQYNARTGALEWQRSTNPNPGFREFLSSVDVSNKAIYVAGASIKDFSYSEVLVRAYDSDNGAVLFEDRTQRGPTSAAMGIAAIRKTVFAVGWSDSASSPFPPFSQDFLIRAYDVGFIEVGSDKKNATD